MFEVRLSVLDVRERETAPPSFLGIVEGFPSVMAHAASADACEAAVVDALEDFLRRLQDDDATRLQLDEFPTVRVVRLRIGPCPA
ncbi:MAG: hypothetical protein ACYDFT_05985 [Thermoplasmata archaeon]